MSGELERARRVLAEHQLDERGECLTCKRRRCQARSIAKAIIIGAGESLPSGCGTDPAGTG